jgi:hypothetical protein
MRRSQRSVVESGDGGFIVGRWIGEWWWASRGSGRRWDGLRLRLRRRPPSVRAEPLPRREKEKGRRWNDEVACTKAVDQGAACALETATTQDVEGEPPLGGCRGAEAEVVGIATVHGRGYTQGRLACMQAVDRGRACQETATTLRGSLL